MISIRRPLPAPPATGAGFAGYIAKALAARPLVGAAFLGSHLLERAVLSLSRSRGIRFEDLSPDQPLRRPSLQLLDTLQATAAKRAAGGQTVALAGRGGT